MPNAVPILNLHHKRDKAYPYFRYKYNVWGIHFHWPTLIPTRPKIQANIIMITYNHTGLRDNKDQNLGWCGHVPCRTNPKSTSQPGQSVPRFLVHTQCPGKTFPLASPHTYPNQGTSHYYHGKIHS